MSSKKYLYDVNDWPSCEPQTAVSIVSAKSLSGLSSSLGSNR